MDADDRPDAPRPRDRRAAPRLAVARLERASFAVTGATHTAPAGASHAGGLPGWLHS